MLFYALLLSIVYTRPITGKTWLQKKPIKLIRVSIQATKTKQLLWHM